MRKEYANALRRLFAKKNKEKNLGLKEVRPNDALIFPGERLFIKKGETVDLFIYLVPHHMMDKFTLDIGWSVGNEYPNVKSRPSGFLSEDRRELIEKNFVFRIDDLMGKKNFWWIVDEVDESFNGLIKSLEKISKEEAESKVIPLIEEAMDVIIHNVFPFFGQLIKAHSVDE